MTVPPTTLLVAAGVHTLSGGPPARCLLVAGDRLVWVGADPADAPAHDRIADLGGAWITPAFVDAHVHATMTGLSEVGVDLNGAASVADVLERVRRRAGELPAEVVVLGSGWDDTDWPEQRPPTATEVGAAVPGRTVLLSRVDVHSCVVDPGTLARLPLDELDGVARDADGEPTGWLREMAYGAAMRLVREQLTAAQLTAARDAVCRRAAALGIGCLHELGVPGLSGLDDSRAWRDGNWPVEVLTWWAELDLDLVLAEGLRPGGDLFIDGSIGSYTAATSVAYPDGGHGELFHSDKTVAGWFAACTAAGVSAGVHAIGDRAIEQAIGALEHAAAVHGADAVRRCRHRIEHLELADRDHVRRLAALGVVASMQPAFDAAWGGADRLYAKRFGADVALHSNPLRWLADAGVPMAFGSDSTVTPLDPWGTVVAATHHRGGLSLSFDEALVAHTLGGRHAAGQDDVGPLRAGMRADLAVWDADPVTVDDPTRLQCLATVVAGRSAHGDLPLGL